MMLSHLLDRRALRPASPVIPVIVLDDAARAVDLARACVAGGITLLEVTLRTGAGLDSIRHIAAEVPEAVVGAGTVLTAQDIEAVAAAGARFAVSPGFSPALAAAARHHGIDLMPGVATASEIMAAMAEGLSLLKFFPAAQAGGLAMLKAFAGPFPAVRFCPTGGIGLDDAPAYLALPNVVAVGGSWLAPPASITAGDWAGITARCKAAAALRPG
jgi:2-dehydro-3-deoxyphosphogluconate aldolase / (4S)-4-hydroxy-2-oxoglutarate aldolase